MVKTSLYYSGKRVKDRSEMYHIRIQIQRMDVFYANTNTNEKMYQYKWYKPSYHSGTRVKDGSKIRIQIQRIRCIFTHTQIQMKICINTNGTDLLISFRQESERLVKVETKAGGTGDCNLPPFKNMLQNTNHYKRMLSLSLFLEGCL